MNWEDECYLLSKKKFRENANIIDIFTKKKGKIVGIVYGGNSRKIRNYLQISNKLFVVNNTKNENKIGYLKTELIKPISPIYFDDKQRTCALVSLSSLLNSLMPESQPHKGVYELLEKFIENLEHDNWIILYIYFELNLIKQLGYDTNLNEFSSSKNLNDLEKVTIDGVKYEVPTFLIKEIVPKNLDKYIIKKSLMFTRNIMLNNFFLPNNIQFPRSRVILENYFN